MPTSQYSVAGQIAVVTGASRGIGRSIAERFAADGADLVICSRSEPDIHRVADTIADESDRDVLGVECDVSKRFDVEAMMAATSDRFGRIDTLVNNAGWARNTAFLEMSPAEWDEVVSNNLTGAVYCTQVAGRLMRRTGGGTVVNISSVNGIQGCPSAIHYGVAKAGLNNFTRALAFNWAEYGIAVNAIAPGTVATSKLREWRNDPDLGSDIDRARVDRRMGLAEEIADVAQFLASEAASFVNGEVIRVQGVPRIAKPDDFD